MLAPVAEFKFRNLIAASRGTQNLGDLTPAQYTGPSGTGLIGGAIQFTAAITSNAGATTEWVFRRRVNAHNFVLRDPTPPNPVVPIPVQLPARWPCDDSYMQDPQPGGPIVDPCTMQRHGRFPRQDRVPSTTFIYDTDAPAFPIDDQNLVNAPIGTTFVMKIQYTEWVECRRGPGAAWMRASDDLRWYIRKTYVKTGMGVMGAPGTWVAQVGNVAETGIALGNTSGAAGQTFTLPGAPFPIVPGSLTVSLGGPLPPAAFGFNPVTGVITIFLARTAGRAVTASFQRPTDNDIGEGVIDVHY